MANIVNVESKVRQALFGCLVLYLLGSGVVILNVAAANPEVESLLAHGNERAQKGDLESAFQSFKQAVDKDPQSVEARLRLAGMQVARGEYRDSVGSFQDVISMQPENANAFVGMGIAYLHLSQYGLARAAFKEALRRDEKKQVDIQHVLDWLDSKSGTPPGEDSKHTEK